MESKINPTHLIKELKEIFQSNPKVNGALNEIENASLHSFDLDKILKL